MLFHTFSSQEERRKYGGSAFIEIQYCKLPIRTREKMLVAVRSISHWKNDSLYIHVDNIDVFYKEYSSSFDCCIYNNLKTGIIDIFGINYYAPTIIDSLIEKLNKNKPTDYEYLIEWINKAKNYNGFYILGI